MRSIIEREQQVDVGEASAARMPAPLLRIGLIGQMSVWNAEDQSMLPTGRKTRALLAILALSAPRPIMRARLAEMLWSRRHEEQARASLRQELHRLLDAIDPLGERVLAITRDHMALRAEAVVTDVDELLRTGLANPATLNMLERELLEDLDGLDPAFDGWLAGERQRLGDRARHLGEMLLQQETSPETMVIAAQRLLTIDRTHEGAWRAMMQAYSQLGERGMAIQAYDRCRAVLAEELDAEPSAATRAMLEHVRTVQGDDHVATSGFEEPQPMLAAPPAAPAAAAPERRRVETPLRERSFAPGAGPCVAVLPFTRLGHLNAPVSLEAALADDLTAAMVRFRWLALMSPAASARSARPAQDGGAALQRSGIDYIVDGTLQQGGGTARITVQLIELARGTNAGTPAVLGPNVLWSQHVDGDIRQVLALQDRVAVELAGRIESEILDAEMRRADPFALSGYDRVLAAMRLMAPLDHDSFFRALPLLRDAAGEDPPRAAAMAQFALWHHVAAAQDWADDRPTAIRAAGELAARAVAADHGDARVLSIAGHVRGLSEGRLREALTLHGRAIQLNPHFATAWARAALAYAYLGRLDEAATHLAEARRLDPIDRDGLAAWVGLLVGFLNGDAANGVAFGLLLTETQPSLLAGHCLYVAALGAAGLPAEHAVARLLHRWPDASAAALALHHPFDVEAPRRALIAGLRAAGLR